jgi:uncharacterized protein (TIGR02996 family)
MSLEEALRAEIAEHPEEDAPRLVYADWLMDQEDPLPRARGEFIRAQCELARSGERGPLRKELKARCRELLREHGRTWAGEVHGLARSYAFERGFLERVVLDPDAGPSTGEFLDEARALFRAAPMLRNLRVVGRADGQPRDPDPVPALLGLDPFPALTTLNLSGCGVGREGVEALAACRAAPRLKRLLLAQNGLRGSDLAPLAWARARGSWRLEALELRGNALVSGPVHWLAGLLDGLLYLGLAANDEINGDALRQLGRLHRPRTLTSLDLSRNAIDAGAVVYLDGPLMARLRRLDLSHCPLGEEGAVVLAGLPQMAGIEELLLAGAGIGPAGAAALAHSPHLADLRLLGLAGNPLGPEGARALANATLPSLAVLDLSACELGPEGARGLAGGPLLGRLTHLDLRRNALAEGALELLAAPWGESLASLHLARNGISREAGRPLRERLGQRAHL